MQSRVPAGQTPHKFMHLLAGLVVVLFAGPLLRTLNMPWSPVVLWITVGLAIAAGSWSLASGRAGRVAGCVAAALVVLVGALGSVRELPVLHAVTAAMFMMFCAWAIVASLRQVLFGPNVDLNRIAGAICAYMLMGIIWATAYSLLALGSADAFSGLVSHSFDERWPELMYFSFVTLTTLGYGDILPLVPLARALAYFEAVIGQMYIAILIAGLVGAHLNARNR